ncbi:MAG: leucyl/phenylalanyl-tRNA--protein transferase, partial [Bacteroidota bacterium]|nr:leucyl/phenylalanyl-tRNA--protein transferase [Bacteroidota bacterium]
MPITVLIEDSDFPHPDNATEDGLLAIDGELSTERLLQAYSQGIFPWYSDGNPIMWWSPDPRMIVVPENYKPQKSLMQIIRKGKYTIKIDTAFREVIINCSKSERKDQEGTWITDEMIKVYTLLHHQGYAHSFETYHNNKLVGGLYGISLGKAFFGESMFHNERDTSKIAYYYLVEFCKKNGFYFIDAQQDTPHLHKLG